MIKGSRRLSGVRRVAAVLVAASAGLTAIALPAGADLVNAVNDVDGVVIHVSPPKPAGLPTDLDVDASATVEAVAGLADNSANLATLSGPFDLTEEAVAATGLSGAIGAYAAAVIVARDQLGLEPFTDLPDELEFQVDVLVDQLLLNGLEAMTMPTISSLADEEEAIRVSAYQLIANSAPLMDIGGTGYGGYDEMNEQEQKVCKREPYDCYRARNTPKLSFESAQEWYPRFKGHNDVRDAFRHCIWISFMVKRANAGFAERMGNAHEDGDKHQPNAEKVMDKHNNAWGLKSGKIWNDDPDQRHEEQCVYYARAPRDLTWIVGSVWDGNRYKNN